MVQWDYERQVICMTTVKEQFMQMLPQSLSVVPDDEVQNMINILVKWSKPDEPKMQAKKKHKAVGSLHHLVDPSKISGEEGAWARAAVEKYRQKMEGADETA